MSGHREAEARLDRLLRWVDREVGEAMADSGFCRACGTGVLERRGSRYRCKACGAVQDAPPPAVPPPSQPSGGHKTRKSRSTRDRHTKDHPSRTGQKKQLRFRRTDKKKKRQKESEEELALFEDFL